MFSLKSSLLLLLAAAFVGASPLPEAEASALQIRAGPSGSVIYPPGGTTFSNPGATGDLHVQYKRVNETVASSQGLARPAFTTGIDLYLEDPKGKHPDIPIATGLRASPIYADVIDAHFVPPAAACNGTYRLVVIEHQFYIGPPVIQFRAAAPTISITCPPFAYQVIE